MGKLDNLKIGGKSLGALTNAQNLKGLAARAKEGGSAFVKAQKQTRRAPARRSSGTSALSGMEKGYAQISMKFATKERLKIYRKLASLMRNRFSLMDGLERCYDIYSDNGRKTGEPTAVAIKHWMASVNNGASFATALDGWAPGRERLMLSVGDVSQLETALLSVIKVSEGIKKMVGPLIGALAYPSFLLFLTFLILVAIGVYMVPPMLEASPTTRWTGVAADLVAVSFVMRDYWIFGAIGLPIFVVVVFITLPTLTGPIRPILDKIPPWSMYRTFVGIGWLLSLSALVRAGEPVSRALMALRNDSTPYLRERIDKMLAHVNNGENLGNALFLTGLDFPDKELVGDLRIYSELDRFEEALDALANDWLEESVTTIQSQAGILNTVAILMVASAIAWAVYGTFEMQDQITKGF